MGIVVACRCGQAFEADAWLAGKVVQCPACRSPLAVPNPVPEAAPVYIPRARPAVSREGKEATESLITVLVVAAVILVAVVGLSIGLVCYLKGTNPVAWFEKSPAQERPSLESSGTANPFPSQSGPVPATPRPAERLPSPTSSPERLPASSFLPSGWNFHEHPSGRFGAIFPDSPSILERMIESTGGDSTVFILFVTQNDHLYEASRELRSYSIALGKEGAAYDAILKMRAADLEGGKIEVSNNVTVDGQPVCDAIIRGSEEGKEYRKYLRLIVSGDSLFQLSCRVPPGRERPADIKAFLGNYRLQ